MVAGPEIAHPQIGIDLLNRVAAELADIGTVEQAPKIEGRNLTMIIAPK